MSSQEKLEFPRLIRNLRLGSGFKQAHVATAIGCAESSYGNMESNNHRTCRLERVHKIAALYGLIPNHPDPEVITRDRLVAAWELLPPSPYVTANQAAWDKRKAWRAKAKRHDELLLGLIEMTTMLITTVPDPETLCLCRDARESNMNAEHMSAAESHGGGPPFVPATLPQCELCDALRLCGVSTGWTNTDDVLASLAAQQERLTG